MQNIMQVVEDTLSLMIGSQYLFNDEVGISYNHHLLAIIIACLLNYF